MSSRFCRSALYVPQVICVLPIYLILWYSFQRLLVTSQNNNIGWLTQHVNYQCTNSLQLSQLTLIRRCFCPLLNFLVSLLWPESKYISVILLKTLHKIFLVKIISSVYNNVSFLTSQRTYTGIYKQEDQFPHKN